MKTSLLVRLANGGDVSVIQSLDQIAHSCERRRCFIRQAVEAKTCYVAVASGQIIGYGVLAYNFFDNGCVDMLYVDSGHRRRGAGSAILKHIESACRTAKLFTSTNLSNLPMQSLLVREGFHLCGTVYGLDPGDPELFYLKQLDHNAE
jgi:GNAT superfamily N-acetyltransferase